MALHEAPRASPVAGAARGLPSSAKESAGPLPHCGRPARGSTLAATVELEEFSDMADIPIALTCADYARVMPLAAGEVKPEGIALTLILGTRGSWPGRAPGLRRAGQDPGVQGGEGSMGQYLYRIENGDRGYVGLPRFPLRNFTPPAPHI